MRKFCLLLAVVAAAMLFAAAPLFAAEMGDVMKDISENGVLRCALFGNSPTFFFHKMENGEDKLVGFEIDIVEGLAKKIGEKLGREVKVDVMETNITGAFAALQAGRVHFVARLAATEERKKNYDFTIAYNKSPVTFMARKDEINDPKYAKETGLKGVKVAVSMGDFAIPIIERLYPGAEIIQHEDMGAAILGVMNGRVDLAEVNGITSVNYVKANPSIALVDGLSYLPTDEEDSGATLGIKFGNHDFQAIANEYIADILKTGQYDKWVEKAADDLDEVVLKDFRVTQK